MTRLWSLVVVLLCVAALQSGCSARPSQPPAAPVKPPMPPMGWNSWNSGVALTEANIKAVIDAMVSSGMRDAGYRYVNLDAGWAAPQRTSAGELQADPTRFPDGMAALATYAHDRGMLLGLYASPFNEGCSAQPALAAAGHETQDAKERHARCAARLWSAHRLQHQPQQLRRSDRGHSLRLVGHRRHGPCHQRFGARLA
ncbi:alpha-galactosidase [Mycolicibacterium sp. CBMA 361]|uniref:alpha-galactosidase n=1 Tax=Mycolicibacterium sp. CBMA 361 TaxID=2606610 RepID=UPI001396CADE|nr:alpha-galactosidase [Mycolicibacterium sp. CBMA 361]